MITPDASIVTIGNFDGVHVGHASLVRRARHLADARGPTCRVVALAFDPHPLTLLRPGSAPVALSAFDRRAAWLKDAGADEVHRLEPTPDFLSQTPEEFVARVVDRHRPIAFVEGPDFRFGRNRAGTLDALRALGNAAGFAVDVVDPVEVALTDHTVARASSSLVRWLVMHGRVGDAAIVLGRPYELAGTVVRGDQRGRQLGFPTANLDTHSLVPADGVYAAWADLPTGRSLPAALSIGIKPTFRGRERCVEAHIMADAPPTDAPGAAGSRAARPWTPLDGVPEYHWPLRLRVVAWIRDQVRFPGVEALLEQLGRDCQRVREALNDSPRAVASAQGAPSSPSPDDRAVSAAGIPPPIALAAHHRTPAGAATDVAR